jgi:tetratricopeptide (TPR) repeat protein
MIKLQTLTAAVLVIGSSLHAAYAETNSAASANKTPQPLTLTTPVTPNSARKQKRIFNRPALKKSTTKPILSAQNTSPSATPLTPAPLVEHQIVPNLIDPLLNKAYQAYQNADFTNAGLHYQAAIELDRSNRDALLGLAAVAQQQGKLEIATQYYQQLLWLNPQDPLAQFGLTSLRSEEFTLAESRLITLLTQHPNSADLYFILANQYVMQLRWQEAETAYFHALSLEPNNPLFSYNLAICLDHLSQSKLATQYYQQALQLNASGKAAFSNTHVQQRINELNVTTP